MLIEINWSLNLVKLTKAIAASKEWSPSRGCKTSPAPPHTAIFEKRSLASWSQSFKWKWCKMKQIYSLILPFYGQIYSPRVKVQNLEQNALKIVFFDIVKILAATCDFSHKWINELCLMDQVGSKNGNSKTLHILLLRTVLVNLHIPQWNVARTSANI